MTDPDPYDMMSDPERYEMMRQGGYQMMNGGDGGGWLVAFAVLTLVLLLVALLAVLANLFLHVRRPAGGSAGAAPGEARSVLDGRLARGEVSAEEYRTVRTMLDEG